MPGSSVLPSLARRSRKLLVREGLLGTRPPALAQALLLQQRHEQAALVPNDVDDQEERPLQGLGGRPVREKMLSVEVSTNCSTPRAFIAWVEMGDTRGSAAPRVHPDKLEYLHFKTNQAKMPCVSSPLS
jgi:hypothetical protein